MRQVMLLAEQTVQAVYQIHMQEDFPAAELKPLSTVLKLMRTGRYLAYGYYEDRVLLAYALMCISQDKKTLLLDYYAVVSGGRSKGVGSSFLQALKGELQESYQGIVLEIEDVEKAQGEEELAVRERRKGFYLKNGVEETDIFCQVYGVDYQILFFPYTEQWDSALVHGELDAFYRTFFPPELYRKKVFYRPPYSEN